MPLTEAQEGLWYAQRLDPANPIFNPAHCTTLRSPLDVPRFARAVDQTLAEAEALSLRFEERAEGPVQRLDPDRVPRLEVRDLRAQGEARAHGQALEWIRRDLARPVDPLRDPLSTQVLFLCGPALALWYQRVHHLAADGYGMALIEGRAIRLYDALGKGEPERDPPLAPLAPVWAEDQAWRAGEARAKARGFWLAHCEGRVPAASLASRTALSAATCLRQERDAPTSLIQALRALEQSTEVAWPDILTALGAAYVARHLGTAACVTGVPAMGRLGSRSARAVATVMNVVPWAWEVDETAALPALLADAARALRGLRRHSRYRAESLRRDLALPGGLPRLHGPILNVLPFDAPYAAAGLDAAQTVLCTGPVEDLTISFRAAPDVGGLRIEIEANPALYRENQVQAHLERLTAFLGNALGAARLADVPTLTPDEHERWALAPNRTDHPLPDGTLWSRILARLRAEPARVGLEDAGDGARTWTYADIDAWTAAACRRLRDAGARPGARVAVALPRSAERVLCMLAILRSGAAYLPLDPDQPAARLRRILEDARACVLIGPAPLCEGLATRALSPAGLAAAMDGSDDGTAPAAAPEDPAYVIYTSGSTGAPKGVIVPHAAIVNRLEWMREHYAIGPEDRILQKTPATFDVSVWELFLPFLSGARLVVAPPGAHRDPAWLCRLIRTHAISVLHFVPSMLAAILEEPASRGLRARLVFCSGEALPAALRDRFHGRIQAALHNLYGPTEAAVDVSFWAAGPDDDSQPIPIGRPVWNTQLHVLDALLRPVPPGVPGQLYLGGRQLAIGYLGRPDLTAERFIPAPPGLPEGRLYASGDLALRREDGAIVYLGRLDHQVKLRGQRIELGEIEAALTARPDIAQAAVLAREDQPGHALLAAYLVAEPGCPAPDPQVLAADAAAQLPDYMVPAAWVFLDRLPVTANGKLDRKALPAPGPAHREAGSAPRTATERLVAQAFRAVLDLPDTPCIEDDFFALGGHSLLAARLALKLRETHHASLGTVFQHSTVMRLAAHLDAQAFHPELAAQAGFGPVVTLREAGGRPALFCIHPAGGLSWCYGALARALPTPRTVHGIQAPALALDGRAPAASLAEMARGYADLLQSMQARGPYHLAGWSVGGILAQAVAVELQARGHAVGAVALLDAYPCEVWRDRPEPAPEDLYKALLHIAGADPHALPPGQLNRAGVLAFLKAAGHPLAELSPDRLEAVFDTVGRTNRLVRGHRHTRYAGPTLHFQAALEPAASSLDPHAWLPHVGALAVHAVAATHAELPGAQAVARIAPVLDAGMVAADPAPLTAPGAHPTDLSLKEETA